MQNRSLESTLDSGRKSVFVSHAHEDRDLASALCKVIRSAYSRTVRPLSTAEIRRTSGVMPGDAWSDRIHEMLSSSHAVWVLVTANSLKSPWIYWEAAIGSVLCPGRVVVVLAGVRPSEVPSPLNIFEIFDGLGLFADGMDVLLNSGAEQFGMELHEELVVACTKDWETAAKLYQASDMEGEELKIRHGRVVRTAEAGSGLALTRSSDTTNDSIVKPADVIGYPTNVFVDANTFMRVLDEAPASCNFRVLRVGPEGAFLEASLGAKSIEVRLVPSGIEHLAQLSSGGPRRSDPIVEEILRSTGSPT